MENKKRFVSVTAGIVAFVMVLGLVLNTLPQVQAASSSEIKQQIEQLEKEQEALKDKHQELEGQRQENLSQMSAIVEEKNIIDQQIGLLNEQMSVINAQISAYAVLISDKQQELDEAEARLAELQQKNKERIRAMEEEGQLNYWKVLFRANSFSDLLDRLYMIEEINAADRIRMQQLTDAADAVAAAKETLKAEKAALEESRAELEAAQAEMDQRAQRSQELLTALIAKGKEFEDLMEKLEDEQDDLLAELSKKEQEFDDAKYSEHMATATKPTTGPSISGGGTGGAPMNTSGVTWLVPVSYSYVSSPYGPRVHPITGEVGKMHHGVDLAGPGINGRTIVATRGGKVVYAGWYGSGGWTIGIDHGDGFQTYYMHMSKYIVTAGTYVTAGQAIGYVGSTGGSTGPHLHFEVRYNGSSVNPMNYIG